ncbi:FK506-binding protein 15 isoform X1 [Cololabis saira]|uniref:FK506-binding protein 15 isoform X1 n=1 Tax=Cololabis saira TaxID=129043 RepID=UPI002AD5ABB6|nr:FK506-binding protein 15 isoform X1 [Cololabis saira]
MFGGDDEDGDFLSPSGGAKLASLFGLDHAASQGNESFQYTAPKQPKKGSGPGPAGQKASPPPETPAVLFASAVQAYKYVDGQYVKQGKLGAAVLGSNKTNEYKLLLYMSQQKQVTAAKIHVGFILTVQPNNYCTFYDDQRQNWSLMFQTDKMASDFCKEVCLAKANSTTSLDAVVIQDLVLGEGQAVDVGDSLELVYTGWLLQNHAVGKMFDSNQNKDKLLRLKIGAGKVIKGWEEAMQGMKKAGHRLVIIPPGLAYGSKGVPNRVPANSTLIFETELRRVKFSRDSGCDEPRPSSRDSVAPSPASSPAPSVESLAPDHLAPTATSGPSRPGEPPLHTKSNSLSEQLANPDATKAKLISRMAKMGQPMLPFLAGAAGQPESSDSDLEDSSVSRANDCSAPPFLVPVTAPSSASAHVYPHPHTAPTSALLPVMTPVGPQSELPNRHAFQPYFTKTPAAPAHMQPGQVYPAQTLPYMGSGDMTSFLITEARQHQTEIRLAMGKVADKVDQLTSKIDDERHRSHSMNLSSMSMETSMIMHNIQRIVQENECLKKEVFEKNSRIEEQNHKIGELINQNQRYMEQSHVLLEQRNDSLKSCSEQNQARILQAEQDKVHLAEDLASSTARYSELQLKSSAHQQKAQELQSKLSLVMQDNENYCQRITALETQLEELKDAAERAQNQYRSEKQRRKEMELRVNTSEEELQDLKTDKESLERAHSERKVKWQAERLHWEEVRNNSQQELDDLRAQLRKARTSNHDAAAEQSFQLQAELEKDCRGKYEQMLALAKEEHSKDVAQLTEQREALQDKLTRLQEQLQDSDEQTFPQHIRQCDELQALQEKCAALEQQGAVERERLQRRVAELEEAGEQTGSGNTAAEVKRVMNGVFHSLRAEFDSSESYSGQAVLGVIISTIKNVTLQLLSDTDRSASTPSNEEKEAEEEEEESEDVTQREDTFHQKVDVNGEIEVKEEIKEDEHVEDSGSAQMNQEVEVEREAVTESQTPSRADAAPELQTVFSPEVEPEEPEMEPQTETETETETESELQQQQAAPDTNTEIEGLKEAVDPDDRLEERRLAEDGQERTAVETREVEVERGKDGESAEEISAPSQRLLEPPANPPPPPDPLQKSSTQDRSVTEGTGREPTPAASTKEDEDDEMNLKGCPPPAPLFGEDEDDDLDWLN